MKNRKIEYVLSSIKKEKQKKAITKAITKMENTEEELLDEIHYIQLKILQKTQQGQSPKKEKKELSQKRKALRHTRRKIKSKKESQEGFKKREEESSKQQAIAKKKVKSTKQ